MRRVAAVAALVLLAGAPACAHPSYLGAAPAHPAYGPAPYAAVPYTAIDGPGGVGWSAASRSAWAPRRKRGRGVPVAIPVFVAPSVPTGARRGPLLLSARRGASRASAGRPPDAGTADHRALGATRVTTITPHPGTCG